MSLLDRFSKECVRINTTKEPDGFGGETVVYTEGMKFPAAFSFDSSTQGKIAEKLGVNNLFSIVTKKNIELKFHDIIKDVETGKYYRITSDNKTTPKDAGLNMSVVSAEEYILPNA